MSTTHLSPAPWVPEHMKLERDRVAEPDGLPVMDEHYSLLILMGGELTLEKGGYVRLASRELQPSVYRKFAKWRTFSVAKI